LAPKAAKKDTIEFGKPKFATLGADLLEIINNWMSMF
jgi:hypothetical protein